MSNKPFVNDTEAERAADAAALAAAALEANKKSAHEKELLDWLAPPTPVSREEMQARGLIPKMQPLWASSIKKRITKIIRRPRSPIRCATPLFSIRKIVPIAAKGPDPIRPINQDILDSAKKLRPRFAKSMESSIRDLRTFLIQDIAPITLTVQSAIDDTQDMLREMVGAKADATPAPLLMKLVARAAEIKMQTYVAGLFNLTSEEKRLFYARIDSENQNGAKLRELQELHKVQQSREANGVSVPAVSTSGRRKLRGLHRVLDGLAGSGG